MAFQTQAQFKYNDLSDTQKQQVKAIEGAYNTTTGLQSTITYNEYILEITFADQEKQFLPLVDIEAITINENNGNYSLKLHHKGGWDYGGLYSIMTKQKAETLKTELQKFLDNLEPFNEKTLADLCDAVRYLKTSKDDDNFYDFEYKMLRLAGITDMDNASYEEMKTKMSFLWKLHSNDFQCPLATNIYPNGNFLRQLARADGEDAFELVLDNYGFDPNVIDPDGCAVFDYLDAQITSDHSYAKILIEKFKKYKAILLKYDAKTANEICGCTKC
ncbi:MAG: hypothetical protein CL868_02170 [Cytophagaceae bacterium]|nr:hypothetical protein [Cytophagaceae bacterium]